MAQENHCPQCGADLPLDAPEGLCPKCLMKAVQPSYGNDVDATLEESHLIEGPGMRIGRYELLSLIGEGGMGLVYQAEQKEPVKRRVALKIIKPGMDSRKVIARFEAERQTLALLEHPNIAHVFDAGTTETGRPYFVMEYVEGKSITKYCDEHKLSVEQRLELFQQVCEGVHHAHQKGIIHRDIKPSNILVFVQDDKPVPKIIDFGIAKAITQPLTEKTSYTEQGQLLGTPEYMSPEQAEMAYQDVDTRSDIYSLGVLLYELLTGATPFDAKRLREGGIDHIQQVICQEEPRTPSAQLTSLGDKAKEVAERRRTQIITLTRRLHRELEWIPMKAMRKDRTRRYRSASELADDIQNYLTGTPLIAGPESAIYRTRKFVRKHAGSVATAALLLVVIVLGLVASIVMGCRAERARQQEAAARKQVEQALARAENAEKSAREQRSLAEKLAEDYRRSLYFNRIALANVTYRDGSIHRVRELLEECPRDLRGWEWYHLNHISDRSRMTLGGHTDNVWGVSFSADGKWIASGSFDKTVKVWDAKSGTELMTLRGHEDRVGPVSFSPDGTKIASGSKDRTIRLWDMATGEELMKLNGHDTEVHSVEFSPNGKRILSDIGGKTVKVWDLATGKELLTLRGHEAKILSAVFSPDSKHIASGGKDNTVKVWDASNGHEVMTLRGHEGDVSSVIFSADGKRIISGSLDNTIKIWDASTGDELMTLGGHKDRVWDVAIAPDGRQLVSAGRDEAIKVWDASNGTELMTLRGHSDQVYSVSFSPDGKRIISSGGDKVVKIWDMPVDNKLMKVSNETSIVCFSADWQRVVSGDRGGRIRIWDRSTGTELMTLHGPKGDMISDVRFSPDGKRLFSSQIRKGTIWDTTTGAEIVSFRANAGYVYAAFSPDGKYIASWVAEYWDEGQDDNTIMLRDAETDKEIMAFEGHGGELWGVVFSSDSKRLASCDSAKTVKIWDVESGKDIMTLKHNGGTFSIAFSPDGRRIASGGSDADNTIRLWDADTGTEIMALKGHYRGIGTLIFSPNGKRLISGSRDDTVKLWDVSTGTEVMSFRANAGYVYAAFSPDGKTIAIAKAGGITLLESEVPADGYQAWRTGAAAREVVDKLHDKYGLYSRAIEKIKSDETIEKSVRKIALQIANARLWEDEKKTE